MTGVQTCALPISDCGGLAEWPDGQVVKALCFYHPDDAAEIKAAQEAAVGRLFQASRRHRLEFLLEVIPSKLGPVHEDTTAALIERFYEIGVFPDWWKLQPMDGEAAWRKTGAAIRRHDENVRGILVLGLGASEEVLAKGLASAAREPLVKGFAVGRTIFGAAARAWMAGETTDAAAVAEMADGYRRLCRLWDDARDLARRDAE